MTRTGWIVLGGALLWGLACSDSTKPPENGPPQIVNVAALPTATTLNGDTRVTALASDPDRDPLAYSWSAPIGTFSSPMSASTNWTAGDSAGVFTISVTVIWADSALRLLEGPLKNIASSVARIIIGIPNGSIRI